MGSFGNLASKNCLKTTDELPTIHLYSLPVGKKTFNASYLCWKVWTFWISSALEEAIRSDSVFLEMELCNKQMMVRMIVEIQFIHVHSMLLNGDKILACASLTLTMLGFPCQEFCGQANCQKQHKKHTYHRIYLKFMVEINKAPPLRYIICGCWIPSSYMNYWFYMGCFPK